MGSRQGWALRLPDFAACDQLETDRRPDIVSESFRQMTTLTDKQKVIVRLRDKENLSWGEIAKRVGSSKGAAHSAYAKAQEKLLNKSDPRSIESREPETAAVLVDAVTDPFTTITQAALQCGFPRTTVQRLVQRLRSQYAPLNEAMIAFKAEELVAKLKDVQWRILEHMDDLAMGGASLKELAISFGVVTDKLEFLEAKPAPMMMPAKRFEMDELARVLFNEMKRRGLTLEGEVANGGEGKLVMEEAAHG